MEDASAGRSLICHSWLSCQDVFLSSVGSKNLKKKKSQCEIKEAETVSFLGWSRFWVVLVDLQGYSRSSWMLVLNASS